MTGFTPNTHRVWLAFQAYTEWLGDQRLRADELNTFVNAVCLRPELARSLLPEAARARFDALTSVQLDLFEDRTT